MIWLLACALKPEESNGPTETSDTCVEDQEFLEVARPILEDCLACHVAGGMAGETRYVLEPFERSKDQNWAALTTAVQAVGASTFLEKPSGQQSHQGGTRIEPYSREYGVLAELSNRLLAPGSCKNPGETPPLCGDGQTRPGTTPLRRLTAEQLVNSIESLLGSRLDSSLFPQTTTGNFRTFANLNTLSDAGVEQVMLAAETASASLRIPEDLGCLQTETELDCARRWSQDFYRRAFRRPLTAGEEKLSTRFLDSGLDVDTALRMQVELALQSPQFLYLDGRPDTNGDPAALNPYPVAARLSYFLTNAPPDEELLKAVEEGHFSTRSEIATQATRLARSPAALSSVADFHQDWLHLWRLEGAQRDSGLYPDFSDSTLEAIRTETDLYTTELVWSGEPTWNNLMFGTRSWVNPELAALYGVSGPESGWGVVDLGAERPGILSRSAWLSAHAYSTDSAPVRRGAWLLQAILCDTLSPPANVNMTLPETSTDLPTIRERLEAHSADPNCASCHDRIDPMGLAFEHFGALGEWREVWDDGHPVVATATLEDPVGSVDGAAELLRLVNSSPRLQRCYAQKVFEYAVGRGAETEDSCTLQQLSERFEASGGNLHQLWVDVAITDAMLYRHSLEAP